jgi:hypothetical protein
MISTRVSMKASISNRDSGGGPSKTGTGPGVGSAMRKHESTGLNGILMRSDLDRMDIAHVEVLSCPVTAARIAAANQRNAEHAHAPALPLTPAPAPVPAPAPAPVPVPAPTSIPSKY